MRKITVGIYRPEWLRGRGASASALLTRDGERCCLGFAGRALGFSDAELLDKSTPAQVARALNREFTGLAIMEKLETGYSDTKTCGNMMYLNDVLVEHYTRATDKPISEADREAKLAAFAATAGYRFVFTNSRFVAWAVELLNIGLV